ncbi:Asparaginyl endopeptidase [Aphelenchoides besseyi]|nr:Asparaginyl endopeptidase [Aphelenchoides besseyi]
MKTLSSLFLVTNLLVCCISPATADTFVVLISAVVCDEKCGGNYGVESDVGRAYHSLIARGISPSNIIVMTPDDFANNPKNAWPGKIFADESLSKNVYEGLKIDYRGENVNRESIMAVLEGDSSAVKGGRVLNSTANDNIFVYYGGHGDHGSLIMPDKARRLTAYDLDSVFRRMHEKKMYKNLVIYVMACYGGSMFEGHLDPSLNVYAITAANSIELARGTDYINKTEATKMGNLISFATQFGRAWLDVMAQQYKNNETLGEQYMEIKNSPVISTHVSQFGDPEIRVELISHFQGNQTASPSHMAKGVHMVMIHRHHDNMTDDSYLVYLKKRLHGTHDAAERSKLESQIKELENEKESLADQALKISKLLHPEVNPPHPAGIRRNFVGHSHASKPISRTPMPIKNLKCHDDLVKAIEKNCAHIRKSNFFSQFLVPLSNLCEQGHSSEEIINKMLTIC